jgi:SAM-dependent methyltransferase
LPSTRRLAERFEVVGVDASERQIDLARANVPGASFIRADLSEVRFEDGTFAAVTALYSISHLPRVEHGALFERTLPGSRLAAFSWHRWAARTAPTGRASGSASRCSSAATTPL